MKGERRLGKLNFPLIAHLPPKHWIWIFLNAISHIDHKSSFLNPALSMVAYFITIAHAFKIIARVRPNTNSFLYEDANPDRVCQSRKFPLFMVGKRPFFYLGRCTTAARYNEILPATYFSNCNWGVGRT